MLSPSEFNNAVPKFTNGNYANNPVDPQYIEEPTLQDYNRGVEPLETLPAQWWNWLCNQFTSRFNKINTYVKNIFDEITQLLSLLNISPDGTESAITTGQLKNFFKELYPTYVSDKLELGTTYVPQTRTVNGHALTGNITITKSDVGLGNVDNTSDVDKPVSTAQATAISTAINALDVASVGGSGKYLSAISETDGKISATAGDIDSVVTANSSNLITSGGVAEAKLTRLFENYLSVSGWYKIASLSPQSYGSSVMIDLWSSFNYQYNSSHKVQINYGWHKAEVLDFAQDEQTVFDKIRICYNSNNADQMAIYVLYTHNSANTVGLNINAGTLELTPVNFETDSLTWENAIEYNLGSSGLYINGQSHNLIDSVTSGNLQPVTSNAVAGAIQDANYVMDIAEDNDPDNFPIDAMRIYRVRDYYIDWTGNDGFIINIPWSNKFGRQIALDDETSFIAVRTKREGSWESWKKVLTADDVTNQITSGDSALVSSGTLYNFFGGNTSAQSWLGKVFGWALGRNWSGGVQISNANIKTVFYGNGVWVAGGNGLYYSTDGVEWASVTGMSSNKTISAVYYANGIWVACTDFESTPIGIYWSEDGINWTGSSSGYEKSGRVLYYNNGIWVMGGGVDTRNRSGLSWSTDGKTWTAGTGTGISSVTFNSIYYGNGTWVAGGDNNSIYYSSDGKSWTKTSSTIQTEINSVFYRSGLWFAVGGGRVYFSIDGTTWTLSNYSFTSTSFNSVYNADRTWVICANDGIWWANQTSSVVTWTKAIVTGDSSYDPEFNFVRYANGIWIAGSNTQGLWYSSDGKSWTQSSGSGVTNKSFADAYFANGTWVAGSTIPYYSNYLNANLQ